MSVFCLSKSLRINEIDTPNSAEKGIEMIEQAHRAGEDYDVLILDMHYDLYGTDDRNAGEKTMKLLREKGIETPVIFCSSQNWRISGAVDTVFFNESRDWKCEFRELLEKI